MQIEISDPKAVEEQALAAGFATVSDYVITLLDRDAERMAIQRGLNDWKAGHVRPFAEFDAELRAELGFEPRA